MNLKFWLTCNECGRVTHDPEARLVQTDRPAPCCGATGFRAIWPGNAIAALEAVSEIDLGAGEGARVGCLFLAAALESVLEEILWLLLGRLISSPPVALALMSRVQGREKLIALYRDLTGLSAAEALDAAAAGGWWRAWTDLTRARNALAHGQWHPPHTGSSLEELVRVVRDGALDAMALLHNAGMDAVNRAPTIPWFDDDGSAGGDAD